MPVKTVSPLALLCAALSPFFLAAMPVNAQATPSAQTVPANQKLTLERVLQSMQKGAPFALISESSIAKTPILFSAEPVTTATVEMQLDALVKTLPRGTHWVKLMMPLPPKGKTLKGDDLADFVLAQARIYGSVGETVLPQGSVEVLSQTISGEKAGLVVTTLNLQTVYLLLNAPAHAAMARSVRDFADLTPEQQKKWAKNAASVFQNMTPKERTEAFLSMSAQLSALIEAATEGLSDDEIKRLFGDMKESGK